MCLLIAVWRPDDEAPLIVAANRDERLDRPALACTVLRARHPRVLGGQDLLAGGSWMTVNEQGVVAALTNRPSPDGRDPTKRSRGELPLAFGLERDAAGSVERVAPTIRAEEFNPGWLLVGDGRSLWYVEVGDGPSVVVEALEPGVHVLENNPLHVASPKADHVRAAVLDAVAGDDLWSALPGVLASHSTPPGVDDDSGELVAVAGSEPGAPAQLVRRPASSYAACVHHEGYGTRSAELVRVWRADRRPEVLVADGAPCDVPFFDMSGLWDPSHGPQRRP